MRPLHGNTCAAELSRFRKVRAGACRFDSGSRFAHFLISELMSRPTHQTSMMVPTAADAQRAVHQARALFARTLSIWACDVLMLRKHGLHCAMWPTRRHRAPFNLAA
jgi:hypothetical protein